MPSNNPVTSKSAPAMVTSDPKPAPKPESGLSEVEQLRKENTELRRQLAAAGVRVDPPAPAAPSFGMSEGTREELERTGVATDPFTGEKLTADKPKAKGD